MALKLITPAAALAISLVDAKLHLHEDHADQDAVITDAIRGAMAACEQQCAGRALLTQTWELTLDAFPAAFELTRTPVQSITSIQYTDGAGAVQTLAAEAYALDNADDYGPAYVVPAYGTSWPTARDQVNAVKLRYVAGYADAASIPADVRSWLKLQIGAMYQHRSAEGLMQPQDLGFANRLLDSFRRWGV